MKVILSILSAPKPPRDEATRQKVADHLGVALEDVLVLHGATVTVVPDKPEPVAEKVEKQVATTAPWGGPTGASHR